MSERESGGEGGSARERELNIGFRVSIKVRKKMVFWGLHKNRAIQFIQG